ncbi:MAG: thioredoxin-dependent thiol peroxidase [Microthrixaceae bacterium]
MTNPPATGDPAPEIELLDQHEDEFSLSAQRGNHVLVYFYPKADTPGCTTQACGLRDISNEVGDTLIVGISPDAPPKLARFDDKYGLGFTLLSDPDHEVAELYGVWGTKKLYGREYMGVIRSAFLVAPDGSIAESWPKISPKDTPKKLLAALRR